jgi:putative tryptophan/tyrosine transport system substrate-binding protein
LWSRSEQKNAEICSPLSITTKSDFVFTRPRPTADGGPTEILHCTSPDLVTALRYAASLPTGSDLKEVDQLKRRSFITLLGGAAAWPFTAQAQSPPKRPLIGFLAASSKAAGERFLNGFPLGMRELGYLEGRDYGVEGRYADGDESRLPLLAEELVRLKPDVILAGSTPSALAAKQATASTPIVGVNLTDPVGLGLAASEARPGTNVTGILYRLEGLTAKQVEIALDLMPAASNMGILSNVTNRSTVLQRREVEAAAGKSGVSIATIDVRTVDEIGTAIQTFARERASILVVLAAPMFINARRMVGRRTPDGRANAEHRYRHAPTRGICGRRLDSAPSPNA